MKSIKAKLILMILSILLCFAVALFISNTFFLDDYYVYKTKKSFIDTSNIVQNEYRQNKEDILQVVRTLHNDTGYKIEIVNEKHESIYSSAPEFDLNEKTIINEKISEIINVNIEETRANTYYDVYENADDSFVMHISKLNKEDYIVITQPLSQILKNAQVANDFLMIVGCVMLFASTIIAALFSKRMVRPILEIKDITDSIAKLDFSAEYVGVNKDEIGQLGSSINSISKKLSTTIGELKEKNEQLVDEMKLQKRFIASVSHEFNSPVGLIRGYLEALQLNMYCSEQERLDIISIIIKEADRLNHLVGDILLLMKLDSKTFVLDKNHIDIAKLIRNCVEKSSIKAKEKDIRLLLDSDDSLFINADAVRMTQVMDNLLSNAITHTPNGGDVSVFNKVSDKSVTVSIVNTGSHILEKDMKHLFDPFYRAQSARTRQKGGSGLGLSIVASIISAHEGGYGVENAEGGVLFWFSLPI